MKQRKILSYALTFILVLAIFFLARAILREFGPPNIVDSIAVIIALLTYVPIKSLVENRVNRVIQKKQLFLQMQLQQLKDEVKYITHLLRLQRVLVRRIAELLKLQVASLFLYNESSDVYELSDGLGVSPKDKLKIQFKGSGGLLVWLRMEKKGLYLPQVTQHERYQFLGKEEKEKLKKLQAELCIPLQLGETIIGILFLGAKPNQKIYSTEELELLQQVADQGAQAILNAKAQRDLSSLEREKSRYQNRIHTLENRLVESNRAYQLLIDYIKTGLLVLKSGNRIIELNNSFRDSFLPELENRFKDFLDKSIQQNSDRSNSDHPAKS
ncbi:GAF domain-containing protein [candidate division KSB1 bacterium]|nr:GAF domain-containing protein [candidate division KSB1 bacterium]